MAWGYFFWLLVNNIVYKQNHIMLLHDLSWIVKSFISVSFLVFLFACRKLNNDNDKKNFEN